MTIEISEKISQQENNFKSKVLETADVKLNQAIWPRLIYSGFILTFLPFAYGIGLLNIQSISSATVDSYGLLNDTFFARSFGLLFFAAFLSNIFFYNIRVECRVAFAFSSICFSLSFFFLRFSHSLALVYISRFFVGFGAGIISSHLPCYLSLIAPMDLRSVFSSIYTTSLVGGLLFFNIAYSLFTKYYLVSLTSLALFYLIYPIFLYACVPFRINRTNGLPFSSLILNPKALKSLLFVASFHLVHNLCGINQLSLNAQSIYGANYQFHMILTLSISTFESFFVGYLIERYGRRTLTLLSTSIIMVCCIALYLKVYPFYFAYMFSVGFNLGMGSMPYIILGEIFPVDFIAPGALFGTSFNWIGSVLSVFVPQGSFETRHNPAFLCYFSITCAFSIFLYFFFRETKGTKPNFQ